MDLINKIDKIKFFARSFIAGMCFTALVIAVDRGDAVFAAFYTFSMCVLTVWAFKTEEENENGEK